MFPSISHPTWRCHPFSLQRQESMLVNIVDSETSLLGHLLCCCCSVTWSCLTLCDPMDCSTPGFPVLHYLSEFAQTQVHQVGDAIQPSHPLSSLLFPPSIFPSIRVFSNESARCIRWPKYWNFSFSVSPSSEYSGVISFRIDGFDLLAVQGTFKSLLQQHRPLTSCG